jgi:D-beta-D-heptose 7-phosphate kinase/D-beta-D-heptose 1-phosphate adenosyltransferase
MPTSTLTRQRLEALLAAPAAQRRRIAIIGDAMLDVYLRGDVDRISPEAPVPVVRVRDRMEALGGAANVAQNVAAVGAQLELVAAIGQDRSGERVRAMLAALGADPRGLVTIDRPTTTKTRVVARGQQVVRVDEEVDTDLSGPEVEALLLAVDRAVADADALILEDYNKGVLTEPVIHRAIAGAQAKGIPVIVDPKYRNFFAYRGATIFKPNRRELEAALGAAVDLEHPEALPAVLHRLGAERLLLTLSERGMALIDPDGAIHRIPTTAREVFDVVGAGDTVTAYLAAMLAVGASPVEAAIVANDAAGIQVGKAGAATVTPTEILAQRD